MDLPLAVGPLLPAEKDLMLLVGDGYIAGYFLTALFSVDTAALSDDVDDDEQWTLEWEGEKGRSWGGIALACILAVVWAIGHLTDAGSYPLLPNDLFGAIPMLSIGVMAGALCAPYFVGKAEVRNRALAEFKFSGARGRMWGTLFAAVYIGFWLHT